MERALAHASLALAGWVGFRLVSRFYDPTRIHRSDSGEVRTRKNETSVTVDFLYRVLYIIEQEIATQMTHDSTHVHVQPT